jgi:hypothetical protein
MGMEGESGPGTGCSTPTYAAMASGAKDCITFDSFKVGPGGGELRPEGPGRLTTMLMITMVVAMMGADED